MSMKWDDYDVSYDIDLATDNYDTWGVWIGDTGTTAYSQTVVYCKYCEAMVWGPLEEHTRKRHLIESTPMEERFKE